MIPLRDHHPSGIFPIITVLLIIINVVVFFLEFSAPNLDSFIDQYALIPLQLTTRGEYVTLITHQFLHGGWVHLISNMVFLWVFGDNIEARLGKLGFLGFYLVAGVVAALAQYILSPTASIPMVGASGAIAGVLGAYLVFFPQARIETLIFGFGFAQATQLPAAYMLGYWFFFQVIGGLGSLTLASTGGVAFMAHIGGFVAGYLAARLLQHNRQLTS